MISIVLTLIGLSLLVALLGAGIDYLHGDAYPRREAETLAQAGFSALHNGFQAYRAAYRQPLPVSGWESAYSPRFGFIPQPPKGMSWSYGSGSGGGYWFCLSGSVSEAQYQGLSGLSVKFPVGAYFLAAACGATTNNAAPATWPASLAATFWVTLP